MGIPLRNPDEPSQSASSLSDANTAGTTAFSRPTNASTSLPPDQSDSDHAAAASARSVSDLPPAALALASKLFDLARAGSTAELSQYLQAGIPLNLTNHEGNTLLMLAAYHGHAATTAMLVQRGADVEAVNDRGQTPLAGAVFKGYDDVSRALVQGGASATTGTPSAIDTAKMFKREDSLRLFGVPESEWANVPGGIPMSRP